MENAARVGNKKAEIYSAQRAIWLKKLHRKKNPAKIYGDKSAPMISKTSSFNEINETFSLNTADQEPTEP